MERLSAEGKFFHRSCFKCEYCGTTLRLSSYAFDVEDGKNGATPGGGSRTALLLFSYSFFYSPGKFYCKPHFCYRVSGYAQRKRPAPPPAPVTAKVLPRSPVHAAPRLTPTLALSAPPHRRTRPPRQERRPWTPPEGRRQRPPASSHPQVAHFRVWPWRPLPAVWPGARPFRCVASAVPFPGPATRWRSTP